jgi:hypothetical protein
MSKYRTWVPLPDREADRKEVIETARGVGWPVELQGQLFILKGRLRFELESKDEYELALRIQDLQDEIRWAYSGFVTIPRPTKVRGS